MQHSGIARPEYFLVKRQYLAYLRDIVIGHVDMDGCFVCSVDVCDGAWLRNANFVWKG